MTANQIAKSEHLNEVSRELYGLLLGVLAEQGPPLSDIYNLGDDELAIVVRAAAQALGDDATLTTKLLG